MGHARQHTTRRCTGQGAGPTAAGKGQGCTAVWHRITGKDTAGSCISLPRPEMSTLMAMGQCLARAAGVDGG